MVKVKKSFWSKLTKLEETDLQKTGQEIKIEKPVRKEKTAEKFEPSLKQEEKQAWFPQISDGKLSVDVGLEGKNVIVVSAIAGVKPADLEIIIDKDILTIKGERKNDKEIDKKNYLHQECFWGTFSRTILLPCEVKSDGIKANLKNGILTIILPMKEGAEGSTKILPKTKVAKGE